MNSLSMTNWDRLRMSPPSGDSAVPFNNGTKAGSLEDYTPRLKILIPGFLDTPIFTLKKSKKTDVETKVMVESKMAGPLDVRWLGRVY